MAIHNTHDGYEMDNIQWYVDLTEEPYEGESVDTGEFEDKGYGKFWMIWGYDGHSIEAVIDHDELIVISLEIEGRDFEFEVTDKNKGSGRHIEARYKGSQVFLIIIQDV